MLEINWRELQKAQEIHDQRYHKDIYQMPTKQRLTHLVLHYSKYAGKVLEQMSADMLRVIWAF